MTTRETNPDTSTLAGKIAVMQAVFEGKRIEGIERNSYHPKWFLFSDPLWNWKDYDYRIAPEPPKPPEPKYRPWNADDMILGVAIKTKANPSRKKLIVAQFHNTVFFGSSHEHIPYEHLFAHWTLLDGSPCGVRLD